MTTSYEPSGGDEGERASSDGIARSGPAEPAGPPGQAGQAAQGGYGGYGGHGGDGGDGGYSGQPAGSDWYGPQGGQPGQGAPGWYGSQPGPGGYGGPGAPGGYGGPGAPGGYGMPGGPGGFGGPGYPAGPGYPGGYGYPAGQPWQRPRRHRLKFLAAGAAVVVALAAFVGVRGLASNSGELTKQQIAAKVDPGLVDVVTTLGYEQAAAAGTGLVLSSSGLILTNNHVIDGATSIRVTDIGNGRTYRAVVVGYDRSHDIAVLQLKGASGLATVTTGNSSDVKAGQSVVAIGNAGGKGGTPSVVTGRVLGLDRSVTATDSSEGTSEQLTGMIYHNAPIQPGDSGGPLVTRSGAVIGIDTAASASGRFQLQSTQAQTQAYAIPINEALSIAGTIEAHTSTAAVHIGATGFLGVGVTSESQAETQGVSPGSGVLITGVFRGSPAARLGLAAGDVIVAAAGHSASTPNALQSSLQRHHPGDRVSITWVNQSGQRHSGTVVLEKGPAG
jgi:S1-C subfamily serine protease